MQSVIDNYCNYFEVLEEKTHNFDQPWLEQLKTETNEINYIHTHCQTLK